MSKLMAIIVALTVMSASAAPSFAFDVKTFLQQQAGERN